MAAKVGKAEQAIKDARKFMSAAPAAARIKPACGIQ
jgi:acyl-CoA synthetase (NDP forming)